MARFIKFKGLKHYPIGQAKLETTDKGLKVFNIGDSGLDGVSIRTEGNGEWEGSLSPIKITKERGCTVNLIGRDGYNRIKTINQQATTYLGTDKEYPIGFSFNSYLLSKKVTLIMEKDGKTVFKQKYDNPIYDPKINWWVVVVAVAAFVIDHIDYKQVTVKDGDGNVTKTVTTKSVGGANSSSCKTTDGKRIKADRIYLVSEYNFPDPLTPQSAIDAEEVQIIGKNIDDFTIENERYEKA